MADPGLTPMMRQYHAMRRELPADVILMFRLGDFYEMFFEDAKVAASILNVALTKRNGMPMCGVPHHAAEGYIARLIREGKRVAIAEQTSTPQPGKLVEREIAQIITAGTVMDLNALESRRNNFLAAVRIGTGRQPRCGLAFLDHTTGEFRVAEFERQEELMEEINRLQPAEILAGEDQTGAFGGLSPVTFLEPWPFLPDQAIHTLLDHFRVQSLDGYGCGSMHAALSAAGAILHYVRDVLRRNTGHIQRLQTCPNESIVGIDSASRANLDLVSNRSGQEHTLLSAMDRTCTPMGARRLRDWILHPLRDKEALIARQDLISALLQEPFLLARCREGLQSVRDIERTTARLGQPSGNPRDLLALASSLRQVPDLRAHLEALDPRPGLADTLISRLHDYHDLCAAVENALVADPPISLKDGGIFRDGWNRDLDELRSASTSGKQWLAGLQAREAERTGIRSLKVRYNAVFGYFIEVTRSNLHLVPDDYQRRQTTANAERFITPELKEMEDRILGADERARRLEYEEFVAMRSRILEHVATIQETADALAVLDVLCSMAECARLYGYTRPVLNDSCGLYIRNGRHPVLDQNLTTEKFVPNDILLEPEQNRLVILTGPNMAGKSTFIRQVALITVMAQTGSFVPAEAAEIGLVDRIFTRVGASDDLARGQSTFMVEMNETAAILNNATSRSLVILDEIGRGTATFDGLSIAWSVAEYLHDIVQCRTIFATHYHELTALASGRPSVRNFNVAVREWNDRIIFLRRIVPGPADRSYGIQVARLAGLPAAVVDRAKQILSRLEATAASPEGMDEPDGAEMDPAGGRNGSESPRRRPRRPRTASAADAGGPETRQAQLDLLF